MASVDRTSEGCTAFQGKANTPTNLIHWGVKQIGNFMCMFFEVTDGSGTITATYLWPNSSGALRVGTTAPTAATQDTAGSAVSTS